MIPWLGAFAVTQLVECPIYARALRGRARRWGLAFALSAATHPIIFFVFPPLFPHDYLTYISVAEAFAVAAETVALRVMGVPKALLWALLANGASCGVGLLMRSSVGWP